DHPNLYRAFGSSQQLGQQVAEMIGRSFESVRGKIKHLGLRKKKLQTEDELEVIEKQFQYEPADTVAGQ
ncbi:unnamed protein product, partial [marine sediment metagenome]